MTANSKLLRMDNVLIVVGDLEAVKAFFAIGLSEQLTPKSATDG